MLRTGTHVRNTSCVHKFLFTKFTVYTDDPEIYDGAPVGLQIVGRKFEEEKIWAIGKIVHEILCATHIR